MGKVLAGEIKQGEKAPEIMKKTRSAAIVMAVLTSFTMSLIGSAMNLSIPAISAEFGVEASVVGWIITGYILTVAALSVPFGRLADITDMKKILLAGIAVFIGGCVGAAFSVSIQMLLAMRTLQGVGGAMVLSANTPILISTFPPQMRGRALGYSIGSVYVGLSLGPVVGGILNQHLGWRSIFIFALVFSIIAFAVSAAGIPEMRARGPKREMDWGGSVLFIIAITLFMLGMSNVSGGAVPVCVAAAGLAVGIAFVMFENRRENPVINVSLFRSSRGYTLSNVAALMNYMATFAVSYLTSIYLQVVQGYGSQTAGLIMIVQPAVMAILTPRMGRLSDRFSPFIMSSIGMALCCAGTIFFIFVDTRTPMVVIIIALIVTGVGFAFFSSPNTNAVLSYVDKKDYGVANSVLNTMRSVGQTASMVLVTIIVAVMLPGFQLQQASPEELVHVINVSFIACAVICFTGVFISLNRRRG